MSTRVLTIIFILLVAASVGLIYMSKQRAKARSAPKLPATEQSMTPPGTPVAPTTPPPATKPLPPGPTSTAPAVPSTDSSPSSSPTASPTDSPASPKETTPPADATPTAK
jgi:hypothetical protein